MSEPKIKSSSTPPSIKDDDIDNDKSIFKYQEEDDDKVETNDFLESCKGSQDNINAPVGCVFFPRRRQSKKVHLEEQEQKDEAKLLRKQMKVNSALEDVDKLCKHFNQTLNSNKLEDVAQTLSPKWDAPLEMAAIGWLGDWRPTAILELLRSLAQSSYFSSSSTDPAKIERRLSQVIHEFRIEEAIIDEEMAEIQATCILHLPFRPANQPTLSSIKSLGSVKRQLGHIKKVINKAQQLRCKVLEQITKKLLSEADVVEFLVAFTGTQEVLHQFASRRKLQEGPVCVPVKALSTV